MTVRDEPERIEIELLPVDGETLGFQRPPDEAVAPRPVTTGTSRSVVLVGAAFGIVGLLAGWFIGRASVETVDQAADEPGVRSVAGAAPGDAADAVGDEADVSPVGSVDATEPVTTVTAAPRVVPIAPATPQPGDAEPLVLETVEVPEALVGQGVEIVTYGNGRMLSRLDLSDGSLRTQQVQRYAFGPPRLLVGTDWVVMPSSDVGLPAIVIDAGGEVDLVDVGVGPGVSTVTDGVLMWSSETPIGRDGGTLVATTRDGEPAGEIDLPAAPIGADPAGGFIVQSAGGSYSVDADATSLVSPGSLVALGRDIAVANECDVELDCGLYVIDRASSERRRIEPTWPGGAGAPSLALVSTRSVSPDGERALIEIEPATGTPVQPMLGVVSLSNGAVVAAGPAQAIEQAAWTPDSRFVIYNSAGRVVAFDAATTATTLVSDLLVGVDALAIRPSVETDASR